MQNPSDPFAFLKAQWPDLGGHFQPSQAAMSNLDPQAIDKRIEDLKTVEQWLTFNLNLVKTGIQGLEIQKGTLAAIQQFQQSIQTFGHPTKENQETDAQGAAEAPASDAAGAMAQAAQWWGGVQQQFQQFVSAAQQAGEQAVQQQSTPAPSRAAKAPRKSAPRSPRSPKSHQAPPRRTKKA